jgi:hypothetical protein
MEVEAGTVVATDRPDVTFSITELLPHLRGYKAFLEALGRFNTVGKLRNLRMTLQEVMDALEDRQVVDRVEHLLILVDRVQPLTAYLAEARANLPADHPWSGRADEARQMLMNDIRRLGQGRDVRSELDMTRELETLKADYVSAYADLHRQMVLGPQADNRRQRLYADPRLETLNALSSIELLGSPELQAWKGTLSALPTCRQFHEGAVAASPTCPYCHFRPAQYRRVHQADQILDQLDLRLSDLLVRWRQALRSNLTSETAQQSLQAMMALERAPIERFLEQGEDEPSLPRGFVTVATQALRGIEALTLPVDDLLAALKEGGLPCTMDELEQRFNAFVNGAMRGHDWRTTRLTLDQ